MAKKFQVIRESRPISNLSKAEIAQLLREKLHKISAALSELGGITFIVEEFYLTVSQESPEDFDWRATCYVEKDNRKVSWSDVYWAINTIYVPRYESVSKQHFQSLVASQNKEMESLKSMLGGHFERLVTQPIDDVDQFINGKLSELATNRTFAGWDGMLAVGKLTTLVSMERSAIRTQALEEVNLLIAA